MHACGLLVYVMPCPHVAVAPWLITIIYGLMHVRASVNHPLPIAAIHYSATRHLVKFIYCR